MSQRPFDETPDENSVFPFIKISLTEDREQRQFCTKLIANVFEQGISPCTAEFPEVKIKRQIIDHYLKGICNLTQPSGIYTIEISTDSRYQSKHVIQTDDVDIEFSKVFTENIKNIQHQNSQRANSIFTNDVFSLIYSYVSILEHIGTDSTSPVQTSRHTKVRNEIAAFLTFLNTIRETFTSNEISRNVKHDLQKILAWFIIDYFAHNIDLIARARKIFRPQSTNDDTVIAEQSDYIWDPEWSHPLFLNIPIDISNQAIITVSIHKNYVKVFPLTIDATPLNYNSFLLDRRQNNSLNSTLVQQENLNVTRNFTQQDIQTPSHFVNEEVVETIVTTTQQSISPIHLNLTTPKTKNQTLPQVTLQSTVKPSFAPKYSQMDYQTYRPMTKPTHTQRTFTKSNFAEHNYNYVNPSKTTHPPRIQKQNHLFSQKSNFLMTSTNSLNFHDYSHPSQGHSESFPFFQQNRNKQQTPYHTSNYLSSDDDDYYQPDIFAPYTKEYRTQKPRQNQVSQNTKYHPQNLANIQSYQPMNIKNQPSTQSYQLVQSQNPTILHSYQPTQMQNEIQLPYYLQQHEITQNQLTIFSQLPNAAESLQMTMNPYLMGGSSITSNKPFMVFTGTDPEYSVEDYLNAVTANLVLNIGPEPINTPLHQNWIHRRTALIQTTLDGAAQKWFSVLRIEIKTDWKRFTQEFSKIFDSERNKQHQRVLCNEIRRLPNETIKQLAVRIETLVRKTFSLNIRDYKSTKMTEILMMTLTPQLRKIAIKKRASHPSSIRKPGLDFRKLVDKLEQAEITVKLEETENLKLQYVNRIETNTTHINNIQDSDVDLTEKITEILNIYEKNPNFKGKPSKYT